MTAVWAVTQVTLAKILLATPKAVLAGAVAMGATVMQLHVVGYPRAVMVPEVAQAATVATPGAAVVRPGDMVMAVLVATPARCVAEVALAARPAVAAEVMAATGPPGPGLVVVLRAWAATVATAHPVVVA